MKTHYITKIASFSTLSLATLVMTGCLGMKSLSSGITDDGHIDMQNIVFPEPDTAWRYQGQFPNNENLSKIRPGIDKDNIYQLLGPPHFSAGQYAREWDYILKFYMPDNSVKTCQYKIIFDKNYQCQKFYWMPADCPPKPMTTASPPTLTIQPAPERINLSTDTLFRFDKSAAQDILPEGRYELYRLAKTLRQYQQTGTSTIVITGHTDRKGTEAYNMRLSSQRAQTIANYLVNQGVNPNTISTTGAGESQPIVECSASLPRQQEIDCLQPNRRVALDVTTVQ